jgi:2,3-bisphosphoglycerate-dependent phosphoglycerate mutase
VTSGEALGERAARPSPDRTSTLVLVRHGESQGNRQNIFTGWRDVDLTDRGIAEARQVGAALVQDGLRFGAAFSSALTRAHRSARIILDGMASALEIDASPALNERDYGELTGLDKDAARARWGAEQVQRWRRSYEVAPPGGESLRDTAARVLPFYIHRILPAVMRSGPALVVAHGNSIRALAMALEGIAPADISSFEVATGEVLLYRLNADTSVAERTVRRLAALASDDPRIAP